MGDVCYFLMAEVTKDLAARLFSGSDLHHGKPFQSSSVGAGFFSW
jgi:hypothetical protein